MIQEKLKELELQLNYVCYDKELITRLSKVWDAYYDLKSEVKKLNIPDVIGRSEQLVNFLLHLNDKELINNHDFDYEKEAKKYLKKIN